MILRFTLPPKHCALTARSPRAARYIANIAASSLIFLDPGQSKALLDIFTQGLNNAD
jgi:hypothetical protein